MRQAGPWAQAWQRWECALAGVPAGDALGEAEVAALFGKEAGLFCATGSLANLLGIWLHVRPGSEVLCDAWAHIARAEMGAHGALHGVTMRTWAAPRGRLDADAAQLQRLPFSRAVLDFDNYPFLARFHAYVDNILTLSLPETLIVWLCRVLVHRGEMAVHLEMMSEELVRMGAAFRGPTQALAKYLLFEIVRLELVLGTHLNSQDAFRWSLDIDDLSNLAENCVDTWLREAPQVFGPHRPHELEQLAAVGAIQPGQQAQQRALAAAGAADHRQELAGRNAQVQPIQHHPFAKAARQAGQHNRRVFCAGQVVKFHHGFLSSARRHAGWKYEGCHCSQRRSSQRASESTALPSRAYNRMDSTTTSVCKNSRALAAR